MTRETQEDGSWRVRAGHIALFRAVGFDYLLDQYERLPTIPRDWSVQLNAEPEFLNNYKLGEVGPPVNFSTIS